MDLSKLDLKIELSPSQHLHISGWLENFYAKCKSRMSDPVVEDGYLKISSADIYNFIEAFEVVEDQFDWQRLKWCAQKALIIQERKRRDPLIKEHYKSCRLLLR